MATIIAVDTATKRCSVALSRSGKIVSECSIETSLTHSRLLLSTIIQMMTDAGIDWSMVDVFAVGLGPGSFTGLRIGFATVKGLAFAGCKSMVGIASLDCLAFQCGSVSRPICPVLDARKKEVYTAQYRMGQDGILCRTSDFQAISPEELAAGIIEPTFFIGDGVAVYRDLFCRRLGSLMLEDPAVVYPSAAALSELAMAAWHSGRILDPLSAIPLYVRPPEAENLCKP